MQAMEDGLNNETSSYYPDTPPILKLVIVD